MSLWLGDGFLCCPPFSSVAKGFWAYFAHLKDAAQDPHVFPMVFADALSAASGKISSKNVERMSV